MLWVSDLAEHDRLEANHAALELRRYFESVVASLPAEDVGSLSDEIQAVCERLEEWERGTASAPVHTFCGI